MQLLEYYQGLFTLGVEYREGEFLLLPWRPSVISSCMSERQGAMARGTKLRDLMDLSPVHRFGSYWAFLVAQTVKNPPAMPKAWVWSLGWEDPLEEDMATHSSILA